MFHIGAQQLGLVVGNPDEAATDAGDLQVSLPELFVQATTANVPKLSPGQRLKLHVIRTQQ